MDCPADNRRCIAVYCALPLPGRCPEGGRWAEKTRRATVAAANAKYGP